MTTRGFLESQLIGGALFSPAHALDVLDILSEANFKEDLHRRIFALLAEVSKTGDLSFPQLLLHWMRSSTDTLPLTRLLEGYQGQPLTPLALSLLEMDMREKFVELLAGLERQKSKEEAFELASACKQTKDYLAHPGNDLFESVDRVGDYIRAYLEPEELTEWNRLTAAIPKLIQRIKGRAKTQVFLANLMSLPAAAESYSQKNSLEIISEITTSLLSRKEIPQHVVDKLYELKNNLWDPNQKSQASPIF